MKIPDITISIPRKPVERLSRFWDKNLLTIVSVILSGLSLFYFVYYFQNGLGLAYNDARSHLNIGRRVVEGLKPGLAQLGSVWLPLNHLLMVPTIWNDFMWHSGLSGAIQSMISYVATGILIYKLLKTIGVGNVGRIAGVALFAVNINVLYLQSTAMTELLLMATMTLGVYELIRWIQNNAITSFIMSAFWIMCSTLIRYDGWFLLIYASVFIVYYIWHTKGYKTAEGMIVLFLTLSAFGIFLWFLWNLLIFKDPLYFALGPFSAHAQQKQMSEAGVLVTKSNLALSIKVYLYALFYNAYTYPVILAMIGAVSFWTNKRYSLDVRLASTALLAPLVFNILALYLGFSVLFVQGISGDTWFNIRYGIMVIPCVSFFAGYLIDKFKLFRWPMILTLIFVYFFAITNGDAVTLDDARVGSSQKNVSQVSGYLKKHAKNERGFILISAASHDAIIFTSGLPMKRFIHEGTGKYWESATTYTDRWARWIVMRTYDNNDLAWRAVHKQSGFKAYTLVAKYPFADVYELKPEYLPGLTTDQVFGKQK